MTKFELIFNKTTERCGSPLEAAARTGASVIRHMPDENIGSNDGHEVDMTENAKILTLSHN